MIVHTREARADTLALLREAALPQAGVLHCFTEDWEMARSALDLGFYISLSGIVTFRNADALREVARQVPADRLLVETDSPYLAPIPHRGKPNLPEYVRDVAEFLATLRGVSLETLAEQTTANFHRLFPLARQAGARIKNPGSGDESGSRPLEWNKGTHSSVPSLAGYLGEIPRASTFQYWSCSWGVQTGLAVF